jgi:hypothetical protein
MIDPGRVVDPALTLSGVAALPDAQFTPPSCFFARATRWHPNAPTFFPRPDAILPPQRPHA